MRNGAFGQSIGTHYDYHYPFTFCQPFITLSFLLCWVLRKRLVIE